MEEILAFGTEKAKEHGNKITQSLSGKTVSKRKSEADFVGGLVYEVKKLGMSHWDLLEALEGMCADGRAIEISDSAYKVL